MSREALQNFTRNMELIKGGLRIQKTRKEGHAPETIIVRENVR